MDLSKFSGVIAQLTRLSHAPDFDDLFLRLTDGENKSTRFLIKMEVKRLSAPTRRIMDFRQHSNTALLRYENSGIIHHLTPEDIRFFEKQLAAHNHVYTLGINEAVVAFHNANRNKSLPADDLERQADPLDCFTMTPVNYGSYCVRSEERMHYSSAVKLRIANMTVDAMTSDISTSGLRIKLHKQQNIDISAELGVQFAGLRQEFANAFLKDFHRYQVVGIDKEDKFNFVRLIRVEDNSELDRFITKLITINKHKYKVNVRYQEENITVKGYEQFFLPRMSGLPVYLSGIEKPHLSHLLINENNRQVYDYWLNEESKSQLEGCFQTPWLQQALQQSNAIDCIIYSFYYTQNSRLYFYAASAEDLQRSGLKALFLSFAAKRANFRVFKLSLHRTVLDENKHLLEVDEYKQEIAPLVLKSLWDLSWAGVLQDITNEDVLVDYQAYERPDSDFNQLHRYRISPCEQGAQLSHYKFIQLRKEARFSYKTAIVASGASQSIKGWSNDFSTEGLQIELEMPMDIQLGNRIYLELPNLQKLSKRIELANIPYKVVGFNKAKNILHLNISGDKEEHIGRQFFAMLIENNKDKLKIMPEPRQSPGLTTVLRNVYCHHLSTTPLYIHKNNHNYVMDKIGLSDSGSSLTKLLTQFGSDAQPYNLYPLMVNESVRKEIETALASLKPSYRPWQRVIYIAVAKDSSSSEPLPEVKTVFETDFADPIERKMFVTKALTQGDFYAIQLMLSRTGRPDMEYIAKELNYVSHYAVHRAQKLEEDLWSVQGVADLIDVTDELLYRLGLRRTREKIAAC